MVLVLEQLTAVCLFYKHTWMISWRSMKGKNRYPAGTNNNTFQCTHKQQKDHTTIWPMITASPWSMKQLELTTVASAKTVLFVSLHNFYFNAYIIVFVASLLFLFSCNCMYCIVYIPCLQLYKCHLKPVIVTHFSCVKMILMKYFN